MRIVRAIAAAAVAAGLVLSAPAGAQPAAVDEAFIADFYANLAADPASFREAIETFTGPMPDDIWSVFAGHMTPLIADPAYADYVAANLDPTLAAGDVEATLAAFIGWGNTSIFGLRRLGPEMQAANFRASEDLYGWWRDNEPAACPRVTMASGLGMVAGPTIAAVLPRVAADIGPAEFRFYAAMGRSYTDALMLANAAAINAEIHGTPSPRTLSADEAAAALAAYQSAFLARLEAAPNAEAIQSLLLLGVTAVDPAVVCDFAVLNSAPLRDLALADRDRAMLALVTAMAGSATPAAPAPRTRTEPDLRDTPVDIAANIQLEAEFRPLADMIVEAITPHVTELAADPAFAALTAGLDEDEIAMAVFQAFARGLPQRPAEDQAAFFTFLGSIFAWADGGLRVCGVISTFDTEPLPATRFVITFITATGVDAIERIAIVVADAIRAGVSNEAPRAPLADADAAAALAAYAAAVQDRIKAAPNADELLAATPGVAAMDADVSCDLSAIAFAAIEDLPPSQRPYVTTSLVGQLTFLADIMAVLGPE